MFAAVLSIGGHTLSVEGHSAEQFVNRTGCASPFVVQATHPEWRVCYDNEVPPLANPTLLSRFRYEENESMCSFYCEGDEYQLIIVSKTGEHQVRISYTMGSNVVLASTCDDVSMVRFSLWFAYSMLSAKSLVTFVHSSTVVFRGKAVMFLGESGTGKSTHSRMWINSIGGARLLNDDSPVITSDGVPMAYGSPWSGKTPCYHAVSFPIAAIVRLSQAPCNDIRRLSTMEAFAALQPSLPPALMQSELYADMLVEIISRVIRRVPVFHLQCLPNEDAARVCFNAIFDGSGC